VVTTAFDPTRLLELPPDARARLAQQLAALVTPQRLQRMDEVLAARTARLAVVFEDVYHPHNASAVLRTCECLGVQDVHIVEDAKRFRPLRDIARGSARWLTLRRWGGEHPGDIDACLAHLRGEGFAILATSPRADAVPLEEVPLDRPLAVCFGTEETGLSPAAFAAADVKVTIPTPGFTRSLNVSVTAALILYHLVNRLRATQPAASWQLPASRCDDLRLLWVAGESRSALALVHGALKEAGLLPPPVPYFEDRPRARD
jgi:tRNA (guanosine-2'-O-)-methyltransferase